MSSPGKGRYTTFVPPASTRNQKLNRLFNGRAEGKGDLYGETYQTDQAKAAEEAVKVATDNDKGLFPADGTQVGDLNMFPEGVRLDFTDSPNLNEVAWKKAGDPANPYMPDVSSPGPGKTDGTQKDQDPKITVSDVKGVQYVPGAPSTGTTSPDKTSPLLGNGPIGKTLVKGKSSV